MVDYITVEIDAVLHQTPNAILIAVNDEEIWIPKSCIRFGPEEVDEDIITLDIESSIARSKGL